MKKPTIVFGTLAAGFVLATVTVLPAAAAPINAGNIKNASSSEGNLGVCRDWSGTSADPGCKSGTPRGSLSPGQNSKTKYGWADTDGRIIPAGCQDNYGNRGPKEVKTPGFFGITKTYRLDC